MIDQLTPEERAMCEKAAKAFPINLDVAPEPFHAVRYHQPRGPKPGTPQPHLLGENGKPLYRKKRLSER